MRCATSATRASAFVRGAGEDASGVDANDIRQGFIGDCFFLSPLMATARINPGKVAKLVRGPIGESPSGGSVYEVKLYNDSGDLVTHHVDDRFISNADGTPRYAQYGDRSAAGPELWVMLMEKAWASQRSSRTLRRRSPTAGGRRHLGVRGEHLGARAARPRRAGRRCTPRSRSRRSRRSTSREGEELEFAGARWRVVEITEDPVHRRGGVILERIQA